MVKTELSGWTKQVYDLVDSFSFPVFELSDLYDRSEQLLQVYPKNRSVEAKIRQQLQYLRDMNLITFLNDGVYVRNWVTNYRFVDPKITDDPILLQQKLHEAQNYIRFMSEKVSGLVRHFND